MKNFPETKNFIDDYGNNALNIAAFDAGCGDAETIKFLIKKGGFKVTDANFKGRNCFLQAARSGSINALKYLHKNYPELKNSLDNEGNSALDLAMRKPIADNHYRPYDESIDFLKDIGITRKNRSYLKRKTLITDEDDRACAKSSKLTFDSMED